MNGYPKARRAAPPLDQAGLEQLALKYVGRFATTRARLTAYLNRKVRERGWDGPRPPDLPALAERFAGLGYIDDAAYALAEARSLTSRGYGRRRVDEALRRAGIADEDGGTARQLAREEAVAAALRLAERRGIGPFAAKAPADRREREKAIAILVRAGHSFGLARAIVELEAGAPVDLDNLCERALLTAV